MADEALETVAPVTEAPPPAADEPISGESGEDQWKQDLAAAYRKAAAPKEEGEPDAEEKPAKASKPVAGLDDEKPEAEKPAADKAKADDKKAEADEDDGTDKPDDKDDPVLKTFPATLPKEVKEHWSKIPERARELLANHERTLSAKVADAGRKAQAAEQLRAGLEPVRSSLEDAVKKFPTLADMRPEDLARRVTETAQTIELLNTNPLGALLREAQHRGVVDQLREVLNGQQPGDNGQHTQRLMQTIEGLQRQVQELSDPDRFRQMLDEREHERHVASYNDVVEGFASSAEHWPIVESHLPRYIEIIQIEQPQLAGRDLLDAAYQRAIRGLGLEPERGDGQAQGLAPLQQPQAIDAGRQIQAKNVNVPRRTEGEPKPLEGQALFREAYRRAQKRQSLA